ncbi:uncharacterized protein LOC113596647 [Acinonyx jubatus]|uniref:Uncharacterized protein LOC113596647 n=1 Tax=Acinonyx jubatus TaxID=32536 RepID=A0ABM3PJA4_ACIJB|nr:uncharacterized protein LOC113596647 [Acinonyx jubatus]XP_053071764.1 uncharacterized protein LOC113596647 [Acinonyx jubatus]XP_053071765.1 uncharacterized protein LOC113596647 [Acinonyx jubatus]XP_053071766.1 uncharacterized protein LOC113596647 [Acinonyx jubatus]XP_053071767.1 uncharacterized protein LOC113596647 [Acinonyx jubatus]XP_053071768.1 uncharacterized protein LOC113596647 [Acinonyx jubatus]XP_053071769.1 uncharacterized protein LOC113596647 [Acinonyx jubatus]
MGPQWLVRPEDWTWGQKGMLGWPGSMDWGQKGPASPAPCLSLPLPIQFLMAVAHTLGSRSPEAPGVSAGMTAQRKKPFHMRNKYAKRWGEVQEGGGRMRLGRPAGPSLPRSIQVLNLKAQCLQNLPIQGNPGWLTLEIRWVLTAGTSLKEQLPGVEPVQFFPWRPRKPHWAPCSFQTLQSAKPLPHVRSKVLQEAPGCQQEAGALVPSSPAPTVPSECVRLVCPAGLPYLSGGGSCHLGGLRELWQAGCRRATFVPTTPPPLRNCLHHIREDRAPERVRMGEGVGTQVPARDAGPWEPAEPATA